ncbi:hypothetical protein AMR72_13165 [Flavobacterium psychrophilum]|nr:hypothetical protein AMR72_13165 [Flavobacterium psychrophilum]AOE54410.1 hypothetical protein ALW18_13155 [Flavobacterium psychrophilum]
MKAKDLKKEWNELGEKYTSAVNDMVDYGEIHGWDNWEGEEPEDKRDHLADEIVVLLRKANSTNTVNEFRNDFPPAHGPLIKYFEEKAQSIEHLHFIENEKIIFLTGTAYQKRRAYMLNGNEVIELDSAINAVGKSKRNEVFAILTDKEVITTKGWEGDIIAKFSLQQTADLGVTELIPFNDGERVLLTTSEGIFIISKDNEKRIHPVLDTDAEESDSYIDMENATLSNDNKFIVVGDQCSVHRVLDSSGVEIGSIGQQSEYPYFCLFSKNDEQLITNSCHFYNGVTIGVETSKLNGIFVEEYKESNQYITIDESMRVYAGVAANGYYILGDAYGYIKAFGAEGKCLWRHFLGSTISGMTISEDGKILWVGSSSGMLHKLKLGKGHRDKHTVGNGNHYEEFRLILWKEENVMLW